MNETSRADGPIRLTPIHWLICAVAAIGFAFDIYELLMLPLIAPDAIETLGNVERGTPEFRWWVGMFFYLPAVFGGIFGLLGGYLTDRLGRRRVLVWSILLYAFSALAAGFSTSLPMLLALRCTTFIGVCVEFVAAVAWLAELFPHGKQREAVLGWTQAFSSLGGIMVAGMYGLIVRNAEHLPAIAGTHESWRYMLVSGVIPAIPLILIRPFMPESPAWQEKKAAGTLRRPSFREIFAPALLRTTVVTTIMMACAYGAAFGAIQQVPQIVPGLPEVTRELRTTLLAELPELNQLPPPQRAQVAGQILATAQKPRAERPAAVRAIPQISALPTEQQDALLKKVGPAMRKAQSRREEAIANVASSQEIGGLAGRLLLAMLAVWIVSRRLLIRIFQVPGLILLPLLFFWLAQSLAAQAAPGAGDARMIQALQTGIFVAGMLTVAQFSFWGNYLPRVYPVHLRGTGESFAANIGGRLIGTSAALVTANLAGLMPKGLSPIPTVQNATQFAYAAAAVGLTVYLIGFLASFWLPEPDPEAPAE